MARFVQTFKDWIVSFPNRYKLIENGEEKTVEIERDWEPDVEGTSNNEMVMNELVKNITYDTDTVHTTEGGTSVYTCDLGGIKEFIEYSSSDSSFIPKISAKINTSNSNQLSKIRFSGKDGSVSDYDLYTINNGVYSLLGANKLKPNTIVVIKIVSNGANKIAVIQYLLDDKYDKTGGIISGTVTINTEAGSNNSNISFRNNNVERGFIGNVESTSIKSFHVKNTIAGDGIILYDDGTAYFKMNNLTTSTREVGAAINYLNAENTTNKSNITTLRNNLNNLTTTVNNIKGRWKTFTGSAANGTFVDDGWLFGFVTVRFKDERGTSTTIPITNTTENFGVFEQVNTAGTIYHDLINIFGTTKIWTYSAIKQQGISADLFASKCVLFYPV